MIAFLSGLFILSIFTCVTKLAFGQSQVMKVSPIDAKQVTVLNSLLSSGVDLRFNSLPKSSRSIPYNYNMGPANNKVISKIVRRSRRLQPMFTDSKQDHREKVITGFNYEEYHTYEDILVHLEWLSKKHPKRLLYKSIGQTEEGRQIPLVVVTADNSTAVENVLFECGIHGAERISPATCLWVMKEILKKDSESDLLKRFNFHIMPLVNPDGYCFTFAKNGSRTWRKNRSRQELPLMGHKYGVDLNRNFDHKFCKQCGRDFNGKHAFSEKETQAIRDHVVKLRGTLKVYLSVHSYSQFWFYPYGDKRVSAVNREQLDLLSKIAATASSKTHGMNYKSGPMSRLLKYEATGNSIDWVHSSKNCELAFATELRDKGRHGFQLPSSEIRPTGEEYWNGVKALLRAVLEKS